VLKIREVLRDIGTKAYKGAYIIHTFDFFSQFRFCSTVTQ